MIENHGASPGNTMHDNCVLPGKQKVESDIKSVRIPVYMATPFTCNSCNTGMSDLPDIYARRPRACSALR